LLCGSWVPLPPSPGTWRKGCRYHHLGSPLFAVGSMDRQTIIDHLDDAERRVLEDMFKVNGLRRRITDLICDGQPTHKSESLLSEFEKLFAIHIADRDRLLKELDESI
jgi:hypothetical protein